MRYLIKGKEIITSDNILKESNVLIEDDKIIGIDVDENINCEVIDLSNYKILPGLIDIHIHGANGYDVMDSTYESLNEISKYNAINGVTSFVATTVTAPLNKIKEAVVNVKESIEIGLEGSKLLGSYIEGPYISKEYKGAHPEEYIKDIDINEIEDIIKASNGTVKIILISPEKANSKEVIKKNREKNIIVSLGHTNATYDEAVEAIKCGANLAVHTYNAMRGLHHREPGMLGAVLERDEINAELICDGIHVNPVAIKILTKCKSEDQIILITDCMMAGGLCDGEYSLGELNVNVESGIARIDNGALAGSTLKLINGIRKMIEDVDVEFLKALKMATINPAKVLGLDSEIGSINIGKRADIIGIDDNYNVIFTMIDGKVVHKH